jgi:predicted phage terminase large subunit-like protein
MLTMVVVLTVTVGASRKINRLEAKLESCVADQRVNSIRGKNAKETFFDGFDQSWIKLLPPEEQIQFYRAANQLVGGESIRDFMVRVAPHEPPPAHLQPILDVIEYARLKPIRIVFDMGPGHAKTTALLRSIAWWLSPDKSPGDLCAYITYSDAQARTKSRICKETLEAAGSTLSQDVNAASFWLTPQGGGLIAAGAQGAITGKRVPGLAIYDDPYKEMRDARSQAINNAVIERFKAVAFTRLQGGSIIVLHTRWHVDDLIGFIDKNLKWDKISIPSVCDVVPDILGRKLGEVAWPEKYPYEICSDKDICGHDGHLAEIKKTLGDHIFNAMYQGKPRPEGTQVFKEPSRFSLKDFKWEGKRGCISIDPAATAKTSADWSVLMTVATEGFGINTRMWIVDVVRQQIEIPKLVEMARQLQYRRKLMIVCEAVSGFKAVPQSLRAIDPKLRVLDITDTARDKYTRAMALAAAWNDGRVMVPMDAPWAEVLIDEFQRFTGNNDTHDDQVDAGAHAWNSLYRGVPKITESDYASGGV